MDQNPDQIDPEVAQEVIAVLNKKVANLRAENAQLQNQLSRSSVKTEDGLREARGEGTRRLSEEVEFLKSELQRRSDPEEVAVLEKKLKRSKQRRQESERELRSQVENLQAELEETKRAVQREQAAKEALEKETDELRNYLNQRTHERDEALVRVESQSLDSFDVRKFLRSELEELPPMPNPVVVTEEGKPRFKGVVIKRRSKKLILSVNGDDTIKWANKGGACVIPLPPVVYNGRKHVAEKSPEGSMEGCSYELFGVDGRCIYYGTYSCVKVVTMNWGALSSLGRKFTDAFLETTVVQDGHAAPVIQSLMENMYQTGILDAACAVLQCEGFDSAIMEEVKSVDGPRRIRNILIHNTGGKRPNTEDKNGGASQGPSKKRKLGSDRPHAKTPKVGSTGYKSRK